MLSNEQYQDKLEKVEYVVNAFLKEKKTIREVSEETGISKSSVQRYLNDEEFITALYGEKTPFIMEEINRKLEENYVEGVKLGGTNFALNNDSIKDELGHFQGSRKK